MSPKIYIVSWPNYNITYESQKDQNNYNFAIKLHNRSMCNDIGSLDLFVADQTSPTNNFTDKEPH